MKVRILVLPRRAVLDPQGRAVAHGLAQLGFPVTDARVGRVIDVEVATEDAAFARSEAARMCEVLLANEVVEDWEVLP